MTYESKHDITYTPKVYKIRLTFADGSVVVKRVWSTYWLDAIEKAKVEIPGAQIAEIKNIGLELGDE